MAYKNECEMSWRGKNPKEYDIMVYPVVHSVEGQMQLTRYMRERFEKAFGDLVVKRPQDCSGVHKGVPYSRMYVRFVRPEAHEHVLRILFYEEGIDLRQNLGPVTCRISNMKSEEVGANMVNIALEKREQRERERARQEKPERYSRRSPSRSPPPRKSNEKTMEIEKLRISEKNTESTLTNIESIGNKIKPLMLNMIPPLICKDIRTDVSQYSFMITNNPKKPIMIKNDEANEDKAKRSREPISTPTSPMSTQLKKKIRSEDADEEVDKVPREVSPVNIRSNRGDTSNDNSVNINVHLHMPNSQQQAAQRKDVREKAMRDEQRELRIASNRVKMLEEKNRLREDLYKKLKMFADESPEKVKKWVSDYEKDRDDTKSSSQ